MRSEPTAAGVNLLLAVATGIALLLLTASATVFATPEPVWRYGATMLAVTGLYLGFSQAFRRWLPAPTPLVVQGAPVTLALAATFPLVIILMAFGPLLWARIDYGLPIIIGAVLFGLTVRSVWAAGR